METLWLAKLKVFTLRPFTAQVCRHPDELLKGERRCVGGVPSASTMGIVLAPELASWASPRD